MLKGGVWLYNPILGQLKEQRQRVLELWAFLPLMLGITPTRQA